LSISLRPFFLCKLIINNHLDLVFRRIRSARPLFFNRPFPDSNDPEAVLSSI
jgi:hypothetical protein